jgi:hypothetical protein
MPTVHAQTEENTLLVLRAPKGMLPGLVSSMGQAEALQAYGRWFEAVGAGVQNGDAWVEIHRGLTDAKPVAATALLTAATGSGDVGAVINGITITREWATSDVVTMALVAQTINESTEALVTGLVGASSLAATIALASVLAGSYIDIKPLGGGSIRFTATAAATGIRGEFSIGGTNAQDATALAAAINAHPAFFGKLVATTSSATVILRQLSKSATALYTLEKSAATFTLTTMTGTAVIIVFSLHKTKLANAITFAATGTNMTASAARLAGGVGGDSASPVFVAR